MGRPVKYDENLQAEREAAEREGRTSEAEDCRLLIWSKANWALVTSEPVRFSKYRSASNRHAQRRYRRRNRQVLASAGTGPGNPIVLPATAGPDTERMLKASVALNACRDFLIVLDGVVAGTAEPADYDTARAALDVALADLG